MDNFLRPSGAAFSVCILLYAGVLSAQNGAAASASQEPSTAGHFSSGRFVDTTERLGIHFRQQASPTSKKYLLETMGSGVA
ncbi:MAG TPA: hypothetical protein VIL63_06320, partial [Terriglobales bacterium]